MTSSLDMIRGRSNVVTLTNTSGGVLVAGDVLVQDTGADESATTTTSAASLLKVYIAAEAIGIAAAGRFYSSGFCPLATPSASVTRGRYLFTHTVAKQCAENATYGAGAFGVILKSGTTPSVWLFGSTAQGSGGGIARSGSTTDGNLAVWNGSSADSLKDGGAIPTASRVLISEQTPTATGTVTFNSIPATYKHLEMECITRTDKAGQQTTSMNLRFNNDTTDANYRRESLSQSSSTITGGAADNPDALVALGATGLANNAAYNFISIMYYAGTTFEKVAQIRQSYRQLATGDYQNWQTVWWENTAAISRIDIIVDDSSNYVTGTTFRLYGVY